MVITAPQTTSFFEEGLQMGLSNRTRMQLQVERVEYLIDLGGFYDSDWDQFASNCKHPNQILKPNNQGALI